MKFIQYRVNKNSPIRVMTCRPEEYYSILCCLKSTGCQIFQFN